MRDMRRKISMLTLIAITTAMVGCESGKSKPVQQTVKPTQTENTKFVPKVDESLKKEFKDEMKIEKGVQNILGNDSSIRVSWVFDKNENRVSVYVLGNETKIKRCKDKIVNYLSNQDKKYKFSLILQNDDVKIFDQTTIS